MAQTVSAVIGGSPVQGAPAGRFSSTNPAHLDEVVADVALGDAPLLVTAARAARQAQRAWAAVPAPIRGRAIAHIGRLVEANKEELARLVSREIGKPYPEALGEVQEIIDTCDFFLGEGRRLYGQTVPSEMPDKQLFTFRNPVGVVGVITAGNFPVAVPSWYIVPALLCGNAVVWKPAEYSAAAAAAFHELFCRGGGLPPGVFNVVYADGQQTYAGLEQALDAGLVDKVGFTGSTEVGSRIGELASAPAVRVPGARRQEPHGGDAQRRPRPRRRGRTVRRVRHGWPALHLARHRDLPRVRARRVPDPVRPGHVRGGRRGSVRRCPVRADAGQPVRRTFREVPGLDRPGTQGSGVNRHRADHAGEPAGWLRGRPRGPAYHPTIVDGVRPGDEIFDQETFGPLVGVATYQSMDEAIELANAPGYGLSSSVYTNDAREAFAFRQGVSAGMVSVNNSTSGAEAHLPFGGNGKSGNGSRQSGIWVLDQFTRWQALNWDYSGRLQKAQMDVVELTPDLEFRL